jgi:hypothetical protein
MVTFNWRLRTSFALVALALGACAAPSSSADDPAASDDSGDPDSAARRHHPPPPPDARMADASSSDASGGGGGSSGDPASAGVISCYVEGNPRATCTLPTHCCFSNYSSQHDGECSTSTCSWGTISCDGPEDCASGQHCCAHVIIDPDWGILGYKLACQTTACGAAPANQELCHPSSTTNTCGAGQTCVSALGNDSDLPPSLYICH